MLKRSQIFVAEHDYLCFYNNSANPDTSLNRRSVTVNLKTKNEASPRKLAHLVKATNCLSAKLTASLEQQPKAVNGVPIVIESCLRYFTNAVDCEDCEGLFRVPGNERLVDQMWDYMQNPFARLSTNSISLFMSKHPTFSPHEVSTFLKRFVGSMDGIEPVLTYLCYGPLFDLMKQECPEDIIDEKCKRIIGQLLVPDHRALLGRLCGFLLNLSQRVEDTRMDISALAVCFGCLIREPPNTKQQCSPSKMNPKQLMDHMLAQKEICKLNALIIETLIKHSQYVFA